MNTHTVKLILLNMAFLSTIAGLYFLQAYLHH